MIKIIKTEYANCCVYSFQKNAVEYFSKEVELDDVEGFEPWIKSLFSTLNIEVKLI